jgi:hypothetical protein
MAGAAHTKLILLQILLCFPYVRAGSLSQSYQIFGVAQHKDDWNGIHDFDVIMANGCFKGLGFRYCQLLTPEDQNFQPRFGNAPLRNADETIPDLGNKPFHIDSTIIDGQPLCLQCCSNDRQGRGFDELWQFKCPTANDPQVKTDLYGYQFGFARRFDLDTIDVVYCDIKRPSERQVVSIVTSEPLEGGFSLIMEDQFGNSEETHLILGNAVTFTSRPGFKGPEREYASAQEGGSVPDPIPCIQGRNCSSLSYETPECVETSNCLPGDSIQSKLVNTFKKRVDFAKYIDFDISVQSRDQYGGGTWSITFPPDLEVPLLRAVNNFTSDTNVSVTTMARRKLHGYNLLLNVKERASGLDFWRAVTKCQVEIIEGDDEPEFFYETWYMAYAGAASTRLHPLAGCLVALMSALLLLHSGLDL